MLKIRLTRKGKKHDPQYRIVVIEARTKRDGKAVEHLGYYNPRQKKVTLNKERAKYWLSVGAQPTDTVISILAKHKLTKQKERPDRPPLKPKKELKEEKKGEKKEDKGKKKAETKKEQKKKEDKKEQKPAKKEDKKGEKKKAKKTDKGKKTAGK